MPDRDGLRSALRELRNNALPHIMVPDLSVVHARARRRQVRRVATSITCVLLAVAVTVPIVLRRLSQTPPIVTPTPTDVVPQPTPTPTPTSIAPVTVRTSVTCHEQLVPTIINSDEPIVDGAKLTITAPSRPGAVYCPGQQIRIFWASYVYRPDGTRALYAAEEFTLGVEASRTTAIRISTTCPAGIYFGAGSQEILTTLPAGDPDVAVYPAFSANRHSGVWASRRFAAPPSCITPTG